MSKILLVEDDTGLADRIVDILDGERLTVERTPNGADALQLMLAFGYELIILDWNLPEKDGIQVCRKYRSSGGLTPILMITGNSSIDHKSLGFESGVDDFLCKPFDIRELLMRVRALLKRSQSGDVLSYGNISLDVTTCNALANGKPLKLRPREMQMLELFLRHPERMFTCDELLRSIWPSEEQATEDAVRVWIHRLRGKLGDYEGCARLVNQPGQGYSLRAHNTAS